MNESATRIDIQERLREFAGEFDRRFAKLLTPPTGVPQRLADAVRYSALAPGKRLRPYLVVRACEVAGGSRDRIWSVAGAIECIHAFSLIHDDLPAMDDDDMRRGRPTCHRQFDEATAILAGDALVALGFELLTQTAPPAPRGVGVMVVELASATGWGGMIGGQAADIEHETTAPAVEIVRSIHHRKTARLIEAACRLGAMVATDDAKTIESLGRYGQKLGLAFQIADDLLDVTSSDQVLGKKTGKDAAAGKQTFPRCVGLEASRAAAREAVASAEAELERFDSAADDLRCLARYVADRNY